MILELSTNHVWTIRTHAESTYPEECCGLLLGKSRFDSKTVVEVMTTENAWSAKAAKSFPGIDVVGTNKRSYYAIAPEVMLLTQREARDRQLDIIGVYHSHPDTCAIPSEFDRVCAWHQYSYIIVSVRKGKFCELKSWRLDDSDCFQPEEIFTCPHLLPTP